MEVIVIGTGNLGYQLCRAFEGFYDLGNSAFAKAKSIKASSQIFLKGYYNHSGYEISELNAVLIPELTQPLDADLIIIATPDDVIPQVSEQIQTSAVVVHTSGSVAMEVLENHESHGVLYFPQTFSKSRVVDFKDIPCCIEYNNHGAMKAIELVGSTLSRKRCHLNSIERKQLHKAAVFMNNFVNHCYTLSYELLEQYELDRQLLQPLMKETLQKALDLGPFEAQTGPARRGDRNTINVHAASLNKNQSRVYKALTQSILKTYHNEL